MWNLIRKGKDPAIPHVQLALRTQIPQVSCSSSGMVYSLMHAITSELLFCVPRDLNCSCPKGLPPCHRSPPDLHLAIPSHLPLCGSPVGQKDGSDPKEKVITPTI